MQVTRTKIKIAVVSFILTSVNTVPSLATKQVVSDKQLETNVGKHCALGMKYSKQNNFALAKAEYSKSIDEREKPNFIKMIYLYRSEANLKLKDYKNAIADANRVLAEKAMSWQYVTKALSYRADAEEGLGQLDDAINDYQEAIKIFPRGGKYHESLAHLLFFERRQRESCFRIANCAFMLLRWSSPRWGCESN